MSDRYDEIAASVLEQSRGGPILAVTPERTAQLVAAALGAAAEEEREACERIAESSDCGAEIVRRIRARRGT